MKAEKRKDISFKSLKEYPLTPLEEALLKKVSGDHEEISLRDLYPKGEEREFSYHQAYDISDEIREVLEDIYQKNIPFDECLIALSSSSDYLPLLYDTAVLYDVPLSSGLGWPVTLSSAAGLLKRYDDHARYGFHAVESLKRLVLFEGFDKSVFLEKTGLEERELEDFLKAAGQLRLDGSDHDKKTLKAYRGVLDKNHQKGDKANTQKQIEKDERFYQAALILSEEFSKGLPYFLDTYTLRRQSERAGRIDEGAVRAFTEELERYFYEKKSDDYSDIFELLFRNNVAKEDETPGRLFVTDIPGALTSLRKHIYILGLSADRFPGKAKEDPYFLDDDLSLFYEKAMFLSEEKIQRKKEELYDLLSLGRHSGCEITLSYPSYDIAAIKGANPSSILFEIYQKDHPEADMDAFTNVLKKTGFFSADLDPLREIGKKGEDHILLVTPEKKGVEEKAITKRKFSPSAIEDYFACPKQFYYKRILRLEEKEDDDVLKVLPADILGTLAHALMEEIAGKDIDRTDFLNLCKEAFEDAMKQRVPVFEEDRKAEEKRFLQMMRRAYDADPHNEVLSAEEKLSARHPSGIIIEGFPDRVERNRSGQAIIADFKTGRKIHHVDDDILTCLQVILYAYILESSGTDIKACVYRYLRHSRNVTIQYDEENKRVLGEMLEGMEKALEANEFPCIEKPDVNKEPCRYCDYQNLCGLRKGEEDE